MLTCFIWCQLGKQHTVKINYLINWSFPPFILMDFFKHLVPHDLDIFNPVQTLFLIKTSPNFFFFKADNIFLEKIYQAIFFQWEMQNQGYRSNSYSILEEVTIRYLWPFIQWKKESRNSKKQLSNPQKTKHPIKLTGKAKYETEAKMASLAKWQDSKSLEPIWASS